jgi:signal transduction histidine kinase
MEISTNSGVGDKDFPTKFLNFARSLNETVAQEVGMEKFCDFLVMNFYRLFEAEKILLLFIDDNNNQLYLKRVFAGGKILPPTQTQISWQDTFLTNLINPAGSSRKPLVANGDFLFPLLPREWFSEAHHFEFKLSELEELIFVPLVAENRIKGFLAVRFANNQDFEIKFEYISTFCSWLAITMDYAWHFEKLQNFNTELEEKIKLRTKELKNTQLQLIQQEKMVGLGQLTAGIAHEINNPLAFVMNNVALLKEDLLRSALLYEFDQMRELRTKNRSAMNNSAINNSAINGLAINNSAINGLVENIPNTLSSQALLHESILAKLVQLQEFKADLAEVKSENSQLSPLEAQCFIERFLDYAELALRQNRPVEIERIAKNLKFIDESLDGLERTKKIVLDLRNFSRLDEAEMQFASIDEGIINTLNIIKHLAREKNIKLIKKLGVAFLIPCIPSKLNQVIMNLVVNAIQASPPDCEVIIATIESPGHVQLSVQDFGAGISSENLPRIFDPYFTTKAIGEGMGLGLSLSYQIIEDHKGTIQVESVLGRGTLFTIKLPFSERKTIS